MIRCKQGPSGSSSWRNAAQCSVADSKVDGVDVRIFIGTIPSISIGISIGARRFGNISITVV